jgi:hypothetical protein
MAARPNAWRCTVNGDGTPRQESRSPGSARLGDTGQAPRSVPPNASGGAAARAGSGGPGPVARWTASRWVCCSNGPRLPRLIQHGAVFGRPLPVWLVWRPRPTGNATVSRGSSVEATPDHAGRASGPALGDGSRRPLRLSDPAGPGLTMSGRARHRRGLPTRLLSRPTESRPSRRRTGRGSLAPRWRLLGCTAANVTGRL